MSKKKPTKTRFQINRCRKQILEGKVLAIDPSSGSASSLPGYALFEAGKLKESGLIELKIGKELPRRLEDLARSLREDFEEVDVLVIEDIPVRSHGRHGGAHASLMKAVGCILGAAKRKQTVEMAIPTWKSYLRKTVEQFPDYNKDDDWDAIVMGYCAIDLARTVDE